MHLVLADTMKPKSIHVLVSHGKLILFYFGTKSILVLFPRVKIGTDFT